MSKKSMDEATFQVVVNLMRELWVVKDRAALLERVLTSEGIDISDKIDRLDPDTETSAQLDAERQAFISRVLEPTLTAKSD